MKRKPLSFLMPIVLALASTSINASALPKQEVAPGGIVILPISKRIDTEPLVYFNDHRVALIPDPDNSQHWLAVIGIPLSSAPGNHTIEINWSDNIKSQKSFMNSAKTYPESRITISDQNKVEPSKEDLDRIRKEQKIIDRAKASRLENIPKLEMIMPTQGRLSSAFGLKRYFNDIPKNPHGGLDIAANSGTPIKAPADGTVVATGDFFFSGNCAYIDHGMGVLSFYGHMTRVDVKQGQIVRQGDQLGTVGATGRVTGAHLHWSVGLNGTWVNPLLFVNEDNSGKSRSEI